MNLRFLVVLIGIILLLLILYFAGIDKVIQTILHSNVNFILLAFGFFIAKTLLKCFRWQIFLKSIGQKVPFSHAFYSFNAAMFLSNLVPFKGLEIIRGYFLKIKFNYSFSKTIPLVLTERVFDVFIYIFFSLITLRAIKNFIPSYITFLSFFSMLAFFLISLAVLLILNSKRLTLKLFKLISILPIINRFGGKFESVAKKFSIGFNQLKKSKILICILLLSSVIWIFEGMIFLFSAKAVGINLSYELFAIPLISILLGVLTLIPGGLGSTEAIMVLFLMSLGFPAAQATSAVLIYRLFVTLLQNAIGAVIIPEVYGIDIFRKIIKGKIF